MTGVRTGSSFTVLSSWAYLTLPKELAQNSRLVYILTLTKDTALSHFSCYFLVLFLRYGLVFPLNPDLI